MPFTYLGLPLGTTNPTIQEYTPLLSKIEKRLSGISRHLSYNGRLILVNSVFSALHFLYLQLEDPTSDHQANRCLQKKNYLWSKGDISRRGTYLVAQEIATKPKDQGGLGIIDIQSQNNALLMKFMDKFYNKADLPWVSLTWSKLYANTQTPPHARSTVGSFWWKYIMHLFNMFQKFAICNPSNGTTAQFQADKWSGTTLKDLYPQLYSSKKPKCSIRFFLDQEVSRIFSLPLSTLVAQQLEEIDTLMENRSWDPDIEDKWTYSWGSSAYKAKKVYNILIGYTPCSPLFTWLWKSGNLGKHKSFFWLLLRDRLSTRNMLRRKNMFLDDYNCVLCSAGCEETSFHLFFECGFSQACWSSIAINWDLSLQPFDMMLKAKLNFMNPCFREVLITTCWAIWTTRNVMIFDHGRVDTSVWKRRFIQELGHVCTKAKPSLRDAIQSQRDSTLQCGFVCFSFGPSCLVSVLSASVLFFLFFVVVHTKHSFF